jgi:hypothetical protein
MNLFWLVLVQAVQGGQIGIVLLAYWYEPSTRKPSDVAAAGRVMDFLFGWLIISSSLLTFETYFWVLANYSI